MRAYTEVDDDQWALTETILDNPPERRRLVRTQIEELFALYRLYPLPELESLGRPTVTRSRITIRCLQRLSSETRMHEQWRFGRRAKEGR